MSFDYFYGPDDAEQYSFYRIPKRLITGDEFQETSTEAKLLYGLMLDRLQLSIRNQWLDSLNRNGSGHFNAAMQRDGRFFISAHGGRSNEQEI